MINRERYKEIKETFDKYFRDDLQKEHQYIGYHGEGDVYTHTMMVVKNVLERFPDSENFLLSAFLHDIGKPLSRIMINNKVIHAGHEGVSTLMSIDFLKKFVENTDDLLFGVHCGACGCRKKNTGRMCTICAKRYNSMKLVKTRSGNTKYWSFKYNKIHIKIEKDLKWVFIGNKNKNELLRNNVIKTYMLIIATIKIDGINGI